MLRWNRFVIMENHEYRNGYLCGGRNETMKMVADQAFRILDEANMPYLVTDGNHDGERFKEYFSGSRYEGDLGYRGQELTFVLL